MGAGWYWGPALLLLLLSHPAAQARVVPKQHFAVKVHAAAAAAASLCSRTDYPALCVSVAKGIHGPTTEKAIIQASIQTAIKKVQDAKARAATLGASSVVKAPKDKLAKRDLQACQEVYDGALADLQSSLKALQRGSLKDLEESLTAVMTDVDTCDDGYAEAGQKSPLAGPDGETSKFVSNGLALAQTMKKGP